MPDLLNVFDLSVSIGARPPVVRKLSFEILAGESVGLVGPSGSGKSLTAMALLGLLGSNVQVSSGHVAYRAKTGNTFNLFETNKRQFRKLRGSELGYVAQDCQSALNPLLTCGRQLAETVTQLRPDVNDVTAEVNKQLDRVELGTFADRILSSYPHQLSGGQLQRILIAMALIGQPRLLIADEPTTALDAITQVEIMRLLDRLRLELGMGMLLITHDTHLLARVADRVVKINQGAETIKIASPLSTANRLGHKPREKSGTLIMEDLTIFYDKEKTAAVDRVSFQIDPGEYVALVGPSGCGKSTLAKWLVGLVGAGNGTVRIGSSVMEASVSGTKFRDFVNAQLVFQDILGSLNPSITVGGVVDQLCRIHGNYLGRDLFAAVGLDIAELGHCLPSELSGGQRQRVVLMRALAAGPDFLVCDEAVAALDTDLKLEMQTLLRKTCAERGIGVLFITHDLREIIEFADRVLVMAGGRIVENVTPQELVAGAKSETGRELVTAAGL